MHMERLTEILMSSHLNYITNRPEDVQENIMEKWARIVDIYWTISVIMNRYFVIFTELPIIE